MGGGRVGVVILFLGCHRSYLKFFKILVLVLFFFFFYLFLQTAYISIFYPIFYLFICILYFVFCCSMTSLRSSCQYVAKISFLLTALKS